MVTLKHVFPVHTRSSKRNHCYKSIGVYHKLFSVVSHIFYALFFVFTLFAIRWIPFRKLLLFVINECLGRKNMLLLRCTRYCYCIVRKYVFGYFLEKQSGYNLKTKERYEFSYIRNVHATPFVNVVLIWCFDFTTHIWRLIRSGVVWPIIYKIQLRCGVILSTLDDSCFVSRFQCQRVINNVVLSLHMTRKRRIFIEIYIFICVEYRQIDSRRVCLMRVLINWHYFFKNISVLKLHFLHKPTIPCVLTFYRSGRPSSIPVIAKITKPVFVDQ